MFYKNVLLFAIMTVYIPTIAIKLTISSEKARDIFYPKTSLFGSNNAYNQCYNILGRDPSYATYNCRVIAQHVYQAQKHLESARQYHKNERRTVLSDIEMIKNDITTCLNMQNKMEKDKQQNPELKANKDFIDIAADIRNKKRDLEEQKRKLQAKDALYSQSYWYTLSDTEKEDLKWLLKDGNLGQAIDEEMKRIQKDLS